MGTNGDLNDLWEFNPAVKIWTWMSGASTANAQGVYGTLGVAGANNIPGGRWSAVGWIDSSGNLWLFGGDGYDSTGPLAGDLNDLWEFNPTTKTWAWMSGSDAVDTKGIYGTLNVAAPSNVPGSREGAISWTDHSGDFWLFGSGYGYDSTGTLVYLNDLWRYQP